MIPLAIAIVFIWAGCILSISFFESWMKFRAPGVDLKIGLSIGKKIFTVLNRIEWILCLLVLLLVIGSAHNTTIFYYLLVVAAILVLQSFWLLHDLNSRAVRIIGGEQLPPSKTHVYFVVLELVKLIILFITGGSLFHSLT